VHQTCRVSSPVSGLRPPQEHFANEQRGRPKPNSPNPAIIPPNGNITRFRGAACQRKQEGAPRAGLTLLRETVGDEPPEAETRRSRREGGQCHGERGRHGRTRHSESTAMSQRANMKIPPASDASTRKRHPASPTCRVDTAPARLSCVTRTAPLTARDGCAACCTRLSGATKTLNPRRPCASHRTACPSARPCSPSPS